jgi:hypothetical protein
MLRSGSQDPQGVDLALAINYLPVCACVLKSLALALALCAVHAAELAPAYVLLLLLLLLDRLVVPSRIFDGNSVLLALWGGHAVSEVQSRAAPPLPHPALLHALLSATWVALSSHQLWACVGRRRWHPAPLALVALHVAAIAFVPVPFEPLLLRLLRYVAFPLLAIGWLYSVGIYRHHLIVADSAVHLVVLFTPTLYAHPYAALAHAAAVVLIGSLQVSKNAEASHDAPPPPSTSAAPGSQQVSKNAEDEELQRVFRQAKSSLQHPQSI